MSKENIYRLALLNLSDTVIITDDNGKFTFICPNISTIFGYSAEEVNLMSDIYTFLGKLPVDEQILNNKEEIRNIEITVQDKKENQHVLLLNVKKISANSGTRLYSFRDITERKKAEIEAQEAIKAKEKLFSIIAHDLRNPFNVMINYSELLLNFFESYNNDKKKECITNIALCSKNMHNLFENLLNWSELQLYGIKYTPVKCYLSRIGLEQIDLLELSAKRKNIYIRLKVGEDAPIYADENMFALILRNLISNAIKFSDSDKEVVISTQSAEEYIKIIVSDEGIGINEQTISEVLETGAIYSTTGTAKEKGTGLGLALCREFIEMNGGKIWAERGKEKGSQFIFTLPKWKDQA